MGDHLRNLDQVLGRLRLLAIVALSGSALILAVYYLTSSISLAVVIAALAIFVFFIEPTKAARKLIERVWQSILAERKQVSSVVAWCFRVAVSGLNGMKLLIMVTAARIGEFSKKVSLLFARPVRQIRSVKNTWREVVALREEVAAARQELADETGKAANL